MLLHREIKKRDEILHNIALTAVNLKRHDHTAIRYEKIPVVIPKITLQTLSYFCSSSVFQWPILLQDTQITCPQQGNCREEEIKTGKEISLWKTLYTAKCSKCVTHIKYTLL